MVTLFILLFQYGIGNWNFLIRIGILRWNWYFKMVWNLYNAIDPKSGYEELSDLVSKCPALADEWLDRTFGNIYGDSTQ